MQRPPAEVRYADELARLARPTRARPAGLAPVDAGRAQLHRRRRAGVRAQVRRRPGLVDRALVTLATNRGLLLVGEPGTAKSLLSELLAAAGRGDSTLTIQGGAATTEDQIKYSWNYALLLAEGPTPRALVPAPLLPRHARGHDRALRGDHPLPAGGAGLAAVACCPTGCWPSPSWPAPTAWCSPRHGFNVIATANTRDRGVNEMSAALKRRFNFETVFPIADFDDRAGAGARPRRARCCARSGVGRDPGRDVLEVLVTTFRELRAGATEDGERWSGCPP